MQYDEYDKMFNSFKYLVVLNSFFFTFGSAMSSRYMIITILLWNMTAFAHFDQDILYQTPLIRLFTYDYLYIEANITVPFLEWMANFD